MAPYSDYQSSPQPLKLLIYFLQLGGVQCLFFEEVDHAVAVGAQGDEVFCVVYLVLAFFGGGFGKWVDVVDFYVGFGIVAFSVGFLKVETAYLADDMIAIVGKTYIQDIYSGILFIWVNKTNLQVLV